MLTPCCVNWARPRCTSRSLRLNHTQIGSSWTMVASSLVWSPPTSSPRYLARGHDPVEGSRNRGVAEIDLRRLHIGLGLEHVGTRGVAVAARLVQVGLGRAVLGLQLLLTGEFGFGIDQRCLGALLRRLCLLELTL